MENSHYRLIANILRAAKRSRIVSEVVTDYFKAPAAEQRQARYLDEEQARDFLFCLMNEPDIRIKTALIILLTTGMRRGELCGLEWADVDFDNNVIHIRRQSIKLVGEPTKDTPTKTKSSVRDIIVSPFVMGFLKEYHKWWNGAKSDCGDLWIDTDKLFTGRTGGAIHPTTFGTWKTKFIEKNNLDYNIHIHGLRHTFISLQIAAGVDIRTLQARTGHSRASTLLDVYTHVMQSRQEAAAEAMDAVLLKLPTADTPPPMIT